MDLTELKYKIAHATGIPFDDLPGLDNHGAITSARALVNMRKVDADQRKRTPAEQFEDWFCAKTRQATPDGTAYRAAMAALDELERQACPNECPSYPEVMDGGSAGVMLGDCRTAAQQFADIINNCL